MKTIFITFLTLAITSFAFAQQPDKVLARVRYTYTNNQDTLKNGKKGKNGKKREKREKTKKTEKREKTEKMEKMEKNQAVP